MIFKRFYPTVIYFILFLLSLWAIVCFLNSGAVSIDEEAKFSAIIAIFVFVSGLFAQAFGQKIKQYNKDKQLKRLFNENLKIIIKGLDLQIGNYTNIIKTLKSASPENIMISSYAELDYFEINKITSEDLYRIFIDYLEGDENNKISTLENLRKELRFIEYSRDLIFSSFEKLYTSIRENSETVITGVVELGGFFDKEATRLLQNKADIERDAWFMRFSNIMGETKSSMKISDDTFTDFEKLELQVVPKFYDFARDNMGDSRTPMVTVIFTKASSAIFQRKDTIKNLTKMIDFYLVKYKEAKDTIEKTLRIYEK